MLDVSYGPRQIVRSLTGRGVRFTVTGGQLKMDGPTKVISCPQVRACVYRNQAALVQHLLGQPGCHHVGCTEQAAWVGDVTMAHRAFGQLPRLVVEHHYWCSDHLPDRAALSELDIKPVALTAASKAG